MREQIQRLERFALEFARGLQVQKEIDDWVIAWLMRQRRAIIALVIVDIVLAVGLVIVGR